MAYLGESSHLREGLNARPRYWGWKARQGGAIRSPWWFSRAGMVGSAREFRGVGTTGDKLGVRSSVRKPCGTRPRRSLLTKSLAEHRMYSIGNFARFV